VGTHGEPRLTRTRPTVLSRARMRWLTALGVTCNRRAAASKEPWSAMATSAASWAGGSSTDQVKHCFTMYKIIRWTSSTWLSSVGIVLHALLAGMLTGLTLIIVIGAQNAFVLRQGIRRAHV